MHNTAALAGRRLAGGRAINIAVALQAPGGGFLVSTIIIISLYVCQSNVQKKKNRRCEDPPQKETVLDPIFRYHTSVIDDPFEILGIEKPAINMTVCGAHSLNTSSGVYLGRPCTHRRRSTRRGTCPLKLGNIFFGQLLCNIRAFFGLKRFKIRDFR